MPILLRNFLIIALLALVLTAAPGGGNFVDGLLTALSLVFIAAIGLLAARSWGQTQMTRDSMSERQRLIFYGALGALALMVVGVDELLASGLGTLVWLVTVAGSGYLLFVTWRGANSY